MRHIGCEQVVNRRGERCDRAASPRLGLDANLCDRHFEYVTEALFALWGIRESAVELATDTLAMSDEEVNG